MRPVILEAGPDTRFQPSVAMLEQLDPPPDGLIVASPCNPAGTMLYPAELAAIARWCDSHGVRLISDGDVSASILACSERAPVDLMWGIGGTPEGVLSAAAIKCIGGRLLGRLWPRDERERRAALDAGDDCFFSATGITDGDVLQGVRYQGAASVTTESLVMRSRSGTVRRIHARHDRAKLRSY